VSPYDPRPVSEGGNRGIDDTFSRKAPPEKFRIVGVDTFDGGDWVYCDVDTEEEARTFAVREAQGKQMLKIHVYDDQGRHVYSTGSF
jgi:hypothetical protein